MFPRLHESWVASIPLRRLERGVSEGGWRIGESGDRERERKCKKGIVRVSEVACPRGPSSRCKRNRRLQQQQQQEQSQHQRLQRSRA